MTTGAIADSGIAGRDDEFAAISSAVTDGVAGSAWGVWMEGGVRLGLTSNQTAAELYVSTEAVEYHLGNVFAKPGIRSRRKLRQFAC